MRFITRLFTLLLLVTILAFTNLVSSPSRADESTCTDACSQQYDLCIQRCTPGTPTTSSCLNGCATTETTCKNKCKDSIQLPGSEY